MLVLCESLTYLDPGRLLHFFFKGCVTWDTKEKIILGCGCRHACTIVIPILSALVPRQAWRNSCIPVKTWSSTQKGKWLTLLKEKLHKIYLENEGRGLNPSLARRRCNSLWSKRNQCCWICLRKINTNNQSFPEDNLIMLKLTPTNVRQDIFSPVCQYLSLSPYLLRLSQVILLGQRLSWGFN